MKHLFRYLRGTSSLRLEFSKEANGQINGYSDADWAGSLDDRKSTSGFVFTASGGAISWASRKQRTVALSSHEAEYISLSTATQEAIWWQGVKAELGFRSPLTIHCDNRSAIATASNTGFNPRSKHIDIRYHFVQDTVAQRIVRLDYISTEEQLGDIFTKPLDKTKFQKFREAIGLKPAA